MKAVLCRGKAMQVLLNYFHCESYISDMLANHKLANQFKSQCIFLQVKLNQ